MARSIHTTKRDLVREHRFAANDEVSDNKSLTELEAAHLKKGVRKISVEEIEAAISSLPPQEFARVRDWFLQRDSELWDRQIAEDSAAGKLDFLMQEIESDTTAGRTKPLNEVINGS